MKQTISMTLTVHQPWDSWAGGVPSHELITKMAQDFEGDFETKMRETGLSLAGNRKTEFGKQDGKFWLSISEEIKCTSSK
jgi:hypothetical protein